MPLIFVLLFQPADMCNAHLSSQTFWVWLDHGLRGDAQCDGSSDLNGFETLHDLFQHRLFRIGSHCKATFQRNNKLLFLRLLRLLFLPPLLDRFGISTGFWLRHGLRRTQKLSLRPWRRRRRLQWFGRKPRLGWPLFVDHLTVLAIFGAQQVQHA